MFAGRWLMSFWMGSALVHELYTAASGLYICWLSIRAATVVLSWMPQGRTIILIKVHEWSLMVKMAKISSAGNRGWVYKAPFFFVSSNMFNEERANALT